jgi:hypothetical protein
MFGPGRNWHRPIVSEKSSGVSQARSSTMTRCAQGMTPPNERAPIARKPRKSSARLRGGAITLASLPEATIDVTLYNSPFFRQKAPKRSYSRHALGPTNCNGGFPPD